MSKPIPPLAPGALPFLGHALSFRNGRDQLLQRSYDTCGPVFALKLATQNVAVLVGPEYSKIFFQETDRSLSMVEPYQFLRESFGDVAFLVGPEYYKQTRSVLHEPFKRHKMTQYLAVMQERTQLWLDTLGETGEIELVAAVTQLVQDIAGSALMGRKFQEQVGDEFWPLYEAISLALDPMLPAHWPLPKFKRRDRARAKLEALLRPMLAERRQNPDAYDDFMQELLNARDTTGQPLDDEHVIPLLLGLLFAGHETTAGQAAWTIVELLRHPEYAQRVQQEVDAVLPYQGELNMERLAQMEHIEWAVREVERVRPSADMVFRYVTTPLEVGDYVVPAGWLVQTSSLLTHNLPEVFANPEQFDPLRYAPDRAEDKKHRFGLIGFGGGIHRCTGMNFANMEMSVITALLWQQFEVELVTQDTHVAQGMGANRPSATIVRYRRRPAPMGELVGTGAATAAGCPYH
ncbi:MAG: cytochrome P450 [Chloroflexi bacterium]|nr:cytochrome P450 [Chloroflexota bacterium]